MSFQPSTHPAPSQERSIQDIRNMVTSKDKTTYKVFLGTVRSMVREHLSCTQTWLQQNQESIKETKNQISEKHGSFLQQYIHHGDADRLIEDCIKNFLGNIQSYKTTKRKKQVEKEYVTPQQDQYRDDISADVHTNKKARMTAAGISPSNMTLRSAEHLVPMEIFSSTNTTTELGHISTSTIPPQEVVNDNAVSAHTTEKKGIWIVHVGPPQDHTQDTCPVLTVVFKPREDPHYQSGVNRTIFVIQQLCNAMSPEHYSGGWSAQWLEKLFHGWDGNHILLDQDMIFLSNIAKHAPHMLEPYFTTLVQALQTFPAKHQADDWSVDGDAVDMMKDLLLSLQSNFPQLYAKHEDQLMAILVEMWQIAWNEPHQERQVIQPHITPLLKVLSYHSRPLDWLVALGKLPSLLWEDFEIDGSLTRIICKIDMANISEERARKLWQFMAYTCLSSVVSGQKKKSLMKLATHMIKNDPTAFTSLCEHYLKTKMAHNIYYMLESFRHWKTKINTPEAHHAWPTVRMKIQEALPTWIDNSVGYHNMNDCIASALAFMGDSISETTAHYIFEGLKVFMPLYNQLQKCSALRALWHLLEGESVEAADVVPHFLDGAFHTDEALQHYLMEPLCQLVKQGHIHMDPHWERAITIMVMQTHGSDIEAGDHTFLQRMLIQTIQSKSNFIQPEQLSAFLRYFKRRLIINRYDGGEEGLTVTDKAELRRFLLQKHRDDSWQYLLTKEGLVEYIV